MAEIDDGATAALFAVGGADEGSHTLVRHPPGTVSRRQALGRARGLAQSEVAHLSIAKARNSPSKTYRYGAGAVKLMLLKMRGPTAATTAPAPPQQADAGRSGVWRLFSLLSSLAVQLGPVSVHDLACLSDAFVVIVNQDRQRPETRIIRR